MIYHVFANRSNIGDWLAAKGIQKLLAPLKITECLCDEPFIEETMKCLSLATKNDLIVIGGGGLLMDYFEPFWKAFVPVSKRVPYCLWGIGYCDNKHGPTLPSTKLIEGIVNQSKLCVVRDEMSRTYLKHCRLPPPVLCPSTVILNPPAKKGKGVLHVANYSSVGAQTYELMCGMVQDFAQQNGRDYRETNNRITKDSESELAEILSRYERSDLVISSGLHGCVIGLCFGLKVLAVSGDRKIEAFMQAAGLKDWILDFSEVKRVPERLREFQQQTLDESILREARQKNRDIAGMIKKLVSKN